VSDKCLEILKEPLLAVYFEISNSKSNLKTHSNLISHQSAANRFPNFSKCMQLYAIAVWPAYLVMHRTIKISPITCRWLHYQSTAIIVIYESCTTMICKKTWKTAKTQNKRGTKGPPGLIVFRYPKINHLSDFKERTRWRAYFRGGGLTDDQQQMIRCRALVCQIHH